MKKLLIFLITLFSFCSAAMSQDFHFIYIRLDASMDYSVVAKKLDTLTGNIEKNNEKFVVLFSNETPKMVATAMGEVQEIKNKFSTTSSFMSIVANDELDALLNVWENNDVCRMNNGKIVLRNNVASIAFDMFVGDEFVEREMQNHILAKFLYASDLQNENVVINYYNSSQLTEEEIKFNKIYQKNNLQIQLN